MNAPIKRAGLILGVFAAAVAAFFAISIAAPQASMAQEGTPHWIIELKDGMQRLVGVALIGQPELRDRLSSQNADVREVAQRCEVVELEPLDAELEGYLRHKFARFDLKYEDVFAPDAADAIRARLVHIPRGGKPTDARSECYPLVVNNLVCRAMNKAALAGWDKVDAQVIAGC